MLGGGGGGGGGGGAWAPWPPRRRRPWYKDIKARKYINIKILENKTKNHKQISLQTEISHIRVKIICIIVSIFVQMFEQAPTFLHQ